MHSPVARPHVPLRRADASARPSERRRYYRTPAQVSGRLLDPERRERACRSIDLSPGGASLEGQAPALGARVVLYLERIGRIDGRVVRIDNAQRFAVAFETSARKREFIAEALIVLLNEARLTPDETDTRRSRRYAGTGALLVELEDGGVLECEVLDFSLVGASLVCRKARPQIGAWVRAGASYGRVARYLDGGFAIDFAPRTTASVPSKE